MLGGGTPTPTKPGVPPFPLVPPRTQESFPTPIQQWEVRGAFRDSGKEAVLRINARTQSAAEHEAMQSGLLVESCWPAGSPVTGVPNQSLNHAVPVAPVVAAAVLIEQTSKQFKWQMLAGFLLAMVGLFGGCLFAPLVLAISPPLGVIVGVLGVLCFIGGFIWAMVAKFGAVVAPRVTSFMLRVEGGSWRSRIKNGWGKRWNSYATGFVRSSSER